MRKRIKEFIFYFLLAFAFGTSIIREYWFSLFLIVITCCLIFLPFLSKERYFKSIGNVELLILALIYVAIFVQQSIILSNSDVVVRSMFYLLISSGIAVVGFSLIYLFNSEKQLVFKLSPLFVAFFSFCFSLTIGALWQILRFGLDYVFGINIQGYNPSDALGFLAIHSIGASLISLFGYVIISDKAFSKIIREVLKSLGLYKTSKEYVIDTIKQGEGVKTEFKATLRKNLHTGQVDKKIEFAILKTINAFFNTKGGILLVGVNDNGEIIGIEQDKFVSEDKMQLHLSNLIKQHMSVETLGYVSSEVIEVEQKRVLVVSVKDASKPCFIKSEGEEKLFTRIGPSSSELKGKKLLEYTKKRFK